MNLQENKRQQCKTYWRSQIILSSVTQGHIWLTESLEIKLTFMFYCKYLHCKEIQGVRDLEKAENAILHESSGK